MMNEETRSNVEAEIADNPSFAGPAPILDGIPLTLSVVLGSVAMPMRDVARLRPGSLVTLDRRIDEPVEIVVNDRVICKGEISVTEEARPRFVLKILEFVDHASIEMRRG